MACRYRQLAASIYRHPVLLFRTGHNPVTPPVAVFGRFDGTRTKPAATRSASLMTRELIDVRGSPDAPVHRRRLLRALREARARTGLSQREIADDLGWSTSKLLRIENGQVSVSRTDLLAMLARYQIDDREQIEDFVGLAKRGRYHNWNSYRDVLDPPFITYLGFEGVASTIHQYEPVFVPGLFQTEEYARMVIKALAGPDISAAILERQVDARMARQAILDRSTPPGIFAVIDEAVLRRCIGGAREDASTMRRQMERLVELNSRPGIDIRVVPFAAGFHPRMFVPFVILEFPDSEDDDLLFMENGKRSVATRDDAEEVGRHKAMLFDLERSTSSMPLRDMVDDILRAGP